MVARAARDESGFGMIELLMAIVMLNIGILAIVGALNSGALALGRALGSGTGARAALERTGFSTQTDGTGAVRADGSTVDPDAEAAKLAANALEHQAAVQVAATRSAILTLAMGAR